MNRAVRQLIQTRVGCVPSQFTVPTRVPDRLVSFGNIRQHRENEIMVNNSIDTDVLIVGAGPVGLFLANECSRRNMRWFLVEERQSQSEHSKALAIFPRTLEIFDMAGIVAPFLEKAN